MLQENDLPQSVVLSNVARKHLLQLVLSSETCIIFRKRLNRRVAPDCNFQFIYYLQYLYIYYLWYYA